MTNTEDLTVENLSGTPSLYFFKKRFEQAFQLENVFMFYMYEPQSFLLLPCILQMSSRISYMYLHTIMSN